MDQRSSAGPLGTARFWPPRGARRERVAWASVCAGVVLAALVVGAERRARSEIRTAFFDGRMVSFQLAPAPPGKRGLQVGPWYFGERLSNPKPRDRRLNLYLVAPGTQHHAPGYDDYDHDDIINDLPADHDPVEWDVYWAVVLDPAVEEEFRSERQLIEATQKEFRPGDLFEFEDIPGAGFLERVLKIDSVDKLSKYRRPSGNLPQVLIVPAGFAVRASVTEMPPETTPAAGTDP